MKSICRYFCFLLLLLGCLGLLQLVIGNLGMKTIIYYSALVFIGGLWSICLFNCKITESIEPIEPVQIHIIHTILDSEKKLSPITEEELSQSSLIDT